MSLGTPSNLAYLDVWMIEHLLGTISCPHVNRWLSFLALTSLNYFVERERLLFGMLNV